MDQKGRKQNDPVLYEDFVEFATNVESRLAKLETEQNWIKKSLEDLKSSIEKLKWWILTGLIGSAVLYILSRLVIG
ncbi:MAG: hypothetical protein QXT92_00400 [Nitrososphaerota archaeon]